MLETWLSKEILQSNSKPRFLTDDEELTEQPSSVRQCSRLLHAEVFGPIINTSVFFCVFVGGGGITSHPVFYINYAFHWSCELRAKYHWHNS